MTDSNMKPTSTDVESAGTSEAVTPHPKHKPGASWKDNETHEIPKNPLLIVFTGLMLCIFLAALDQVSVLSE